MRGAQKEARKRRRKDDDNDDGDNWQAQGDEESSSTSATITDAKGTEAQTEAMLQQEMSLRAKQEKLTRFYFAHNPSLPTSVNEAKRHAFYLGIYSALLMLCAMAVFIIAVRTQPARFNPMDPAASFERVFYNFSQPGLQMAGAAAAASGPGSVFDNVGNIPISPILGFVAALVALYTSISIVRCGPAAAGQHHEKDGPRFARSHRRAAWRSVCTGVCFAYLVPASLLQWAEDTKHYERPGGAYELWADHPSGHLLSTLTATLAGLAALDVVWHAFFVMSALRAAESLADVPQC